VPHGVCAVTEFEPKLHDRIDVAPGPMGTTQAWLRWREQIVELVENEVAKRVAAALSVKNN